MYLPLIRIAIVTSLALLTAACGGGGGSSETPLTAIDLPTARGLKPDIKRADAFFKSVHFHGGETCSSCHNDQETGANARMVDADGRDLSIVKAWKSSMMANSARDPYWHAVVASESSLYPQLHEEINDTCSRCHAPMANEVGRRTGIPVQILDTGSAEDGTLVKGFLSLSRTDEVFNHAMDGVSCSLCHQIADDGNLGTDASMTGEFVIEQYSDENKVDRPAYGQYSEELDPGYMRGDSLFTPVYSAHISTSETCATCHNLKSESVDRNGVAVPNVGHFPEQVIYSEWEASAFNVGGSEERSCQDCHMPKITDREVPIASVGAGDIVRSNFAEHTFLGANTVMLDILQNHRDELGVDEDADFQSAIERNRQFLKTAAEVTILSSTVTDGVLDVGVEVANKTGHKLPSGYHSRRVFLYVQVIDKNGAQIYENGRINDDGSINGVAEDTNPATYEPHHNVIVDNTQVQVYQSIMGNSDDERTHSLLNGTHYIKDNRLTPIGFDKNQVDADIAVTGAARTDDNFSAGKDRLKYLIPVTGEAPYTVRVELKYQPLSFGHLQTLFAESDKIDEIDKFRTLYDSLTFHSESIAADVATVGSANP